jgi:class 3 adenylate cyclase
MFADLRGFTRLAARLPPQELLALLTEWRALVSGIVGAHGGSVDKFLGDGVLASFGALTPDPLAAAMALGAAEDLVEAASRLRAEPGAVRPEGIGIGIAAGPMVVGAIGDETRLEFTVLGDPVNVAAKLEKHAKAEAAPVVATAAVAASARAQGWRPRLAARDCPARAVEGLAAPADLVVLGGLAARQRPSPSQNSFTLAKKPSLSGEDRPPFAASASNCSSNSRCLGVRFCGVSTLTCTYMSPRAAERSTEKPLPRRRNWSPVWVPAGMVTRVRPPSMEGTSTCPPRAACDMRSGTRMKMFAPSRWKIGCGRRAMST